MSQKRRFAEMVAELGDALTRARIPHAFGGAIALAYHGRPRATTDIDLNIFVSPGDFARVAETLGGLGISTDVDSAALERSAQCRLAWEWTAVDVFLTNLPIHAEMRAATLRVPFLDGQIHILSAEHLIVCKASYDRTKDWADIRQMVLTIPELVADDSVALLIELLGEDDHRVQKLREVVSFEPEDQR